MGDIINDKRLAICCVIIIIGVIAVCSAIILNQTDTQIKVLSNSSLYNGENVTVQLTTDNGTPVANQSVNVTIIDGNGGRNTQELVTNEEGKASFTLGGVTVGKYTLECVFGGSNGYKESNATSELEIKEKVVPQYTQYKSKSYSDPHSDWVCEGDTWYSVKIGEGNYALYDKSSGRMIGTGDMPDRHGYHEPGYVKKYSSTVKYRKNGEYYSG